MRWNHQFHGRVVLILLVFACFGSVASFAEPEERSPDQSPSFTFVAFGDRTGGPSSGIEVLEQAVDMANWLDPDLVMTVGDLIEGQCEARVWDEQAEEFLSIMNRLEMPWYPVAGNHDVYPRRGSDAGMTDRYRRVFGPTVYSFDHKFAHFVVLFSDESLGYRDPARDQNMSQAQMDWLKSDLSGTEAQQIFVFLHHPRWTKEYEGCNWDEVHQILKDDGRSTTVIAGHIHTLRDDGLRDNVHYLTLATSGGWGKRGFDYASMHHISQFTVRPDRVSIVHLPVGSVIEGDAFPGIEYDEIRMLQKGAWVRVGSMAGTGGEPTIRVRVENTASRAMEFKVGVLTPADWVADAEQDRFTLEPGEETELEIGVHADTDPAGQGAEFEVIVRAYYSHQHGEVQPVSVKKKAELLTPAP